MQLFVNVCNYIIYIYMYICCKLLLCKPMKLAPSTSHRFILGDSSTGEGKGITTREQVCLAVFRWPEGPSCFNVSVWQLVPNKTQQINHLTWQINHLRWAKIKIIFIYLVFYQIFWGVSVGHGFFCWVSNEFLTSCFLGSLGQPATISGFPNFDRLCQPRCGSLHGRRIGC